MSTNNGRRKRVREEKSSSSSSGRKKQRTREESDVDDVDPDSLFGELPDSDDQKREVVSDESYDAESSIEEPTRIQPAKMHVGYNFVQPPGVSTRRERHGADARAHEGTDSDDDDDDDDERNWESCKPPQDQEAYELLGPPDSRDQCYGCIIAGEGNMPSVSSDRINRVLRYLRESMGRINSVAMAKQAEEMFETLVRIPANRNIGPGQIPIPRWSAATILDHYKNHHTDPELESANDITLFKQIQSVICENGLFKRHKYKTTSDGRPIRMVEPENLKMLLEVVKQKNSIYRQNPKNMQFFSNGSFVQKTAKGMSPWVPYGRNYYSLMDPK